MRLSDKIRRLVVSLVIASVVVTAAKAPTFARTVGAALPTLKLDYNVGATGWSSTLDPADVAVSNDAATVSLMHAGLVRTVPPNKINGVGKVGLDLADRVAISKDRKTYTFHIRTNARFSNGHPVTAQDAIFSIARSAGKDVAPQVADAYDALIRGLHAYVEGKAQRITGLKAIDSHTLQVRITRPASYFLAAFSYPSNDILDRKAVGSHRVGDLTTTCSLQTGAGPFTPVCRNNSSDVTSYYPGGSTPSLTLRPNPHYYGPKPKIMLRLPVIPSPESAYNLYRQGNMDTSVIVPISELGRWRGTKDLYRWGTSDVSFIETNTTSPPFNNVHCRLVVAHAIDRTVIARKLVPGQWNNLYTVVPPGFLGSYNAKTTVNKQGGTPYYSPTMAKRELTKCPHGIDINWNYEVNTAQGRRVREALGSMLRAVGAKVIFRDRTDQEAAQDASTPMADSGNSILLAGWSQDYPDPQDYVSLLLRHGGLYSITGWNDRRFNAVVDKADVEPNRAARGKLYIKAQKRVISEAVWIPMWNNIGLALVKPYIHGLVASSSYPALVPSGGNWSRVSISRH